MMVFRLRQHHHGARVSGHCKTSLRFLMHSATLADVVSCVN